MAIAASDRCRARAHIHRRWTAGPRLGFRLPSSASTSSATPDGVPESITELLVTDTALDKLGARAISSVEAEQVLRNDHVTVRNPAEPTAHETRRLLIGLTDGGRPLTLVIERTVDPTTWLIVTGWGSTDTERKMISR